MKKVYIVILLLSAFTIQLHAQANENALGIRAGYGGGLSYQHGFSDLNRLELNGSFVANQNFSGINLTSAFTWVFNIDGGFNWFIGPAASIGTANYKIKHNGAGEDQFYLNVGGQAGLEYNFREIPIEISLDIIPQIGIVNGADDFYFDPAFGIRYVFGN